MRRWLHRLSGDLYPERNRYRDVLLVLAIAMMGWALIIAEHATHTAARATATAATATHNARRATDEADRALGRVQEGRATSITITCAVISAISEAGRATIIGPSRPVPAEEQAFKQLGFPPFAIRHRSQQAAGAAYVANIARHVNRELDQLGKRPVHGLIRKDGTIDCKVLQSVSAVPNPH